MLLLITKLSATHIIATGATQFSLSRD